MAGVSYIYEAIRCILGDEYSNVFEDNVREDHKYDVGIYNYESQDDGRVYDGYIYRSAKFSVIVIAGDTVDERDRALDYLERFIDKIETDGSPLANITFIEVNHIGSRAYIIGNNAYNLQKVGCSVNIKYKQVI